MGVYNINAVLKDDKVTVSWYHEPTDKAFMQKIIRRSPVHHDEIYLNLKSTLYIDFPPDNATYGYRVIEFDNRGKELTRTQEVTIHVPRGKDKLVRRIEELENRLDALERNPIPRIGGPIEVGDVPPLSRKDADLGFPQRDSGMLPNAVPSQLTTHKINVKNAEQ